MTGPCQVEGYSGLNLRKKLNVQRNDPECCDAMLRVNDEVVGAHRCVLAAVSPYFYTMFYGKFRDKMEPVLNLSHVFNSSKILKRILDFVYGKEIGVTEESVMELLGGADFLMIPEIKALCLKFLLRNLSLDSCLWTWSLAYVYLLEELHDICEDLALSKFHDCLIYLEGTLTCPPGHMKYFLNKGLAMHCTRESIDIFIEKYAKYHDPSNSYNYNQELQALYNRSKQESFMDEVFKVEQIKLSDAPESTTECLIFMAETESKDKNELHLYNIMKNTWYHLCDCPSSNSHSADHLMAIGIRAKENMIAFQNYYNHRIHVYLIDIFNSQKLEIPAKPISDKEKPTSQLNIYPSILFSSVSELYCVSKVNQYDSGYLYYWLIHQFDFTKNEWRLIHLMDRDSNDEILKCHLIFHPNEVFYIFLEKYFAVHLYQFNGLTKEINKLETLRLPDRLHIRQVYGSLSTLTVFASSDLTVFASSSELKADYLINTDTWHVDSSVSELANQTDSVDKFFIWSHTKNEQYILSKGKVDSVIHFAMKNISEKTVKQLKPIPYISHNEYFRPALSVCRVPCKLFEHLTVSKVGYKLMEPLTTQNNWRSVLEKYQKKYLSDKDIDDGCLFDGYDYCYGDDYDYTFNYNNDYYNNDFGYDYSD